MINGMKMSAAALFAVAAFSGVLSACSDDDTVSTDPVTDGITLYYKNTVLTTPAKPGDTLVAKVNLLSAGDIYLGQGNGGTVTWTVNFTGFPDSVKTKDCSYNTIGVAVFNSPEILEYEFVVPELPSTRVTAGVVFNAKYSYKSQNANGQLYGTLRESTNFTVVNPNYVEEEE